MSIEDDTFHLLANPFHTKKRKNLYIQPTLDDEILLLIQNQDIQVQVKILEKNLNIKIYLAQFRLIK